MKYVTENFNALKGLETAALGVLLLANSIDDLFKQSWLSLLMWAVGVVCCFAFLRFLPRYYERRFGRVEERVQRMTRGDAIGCAFAGTIFALLLCSLIVPPLGRFRDHTWTAINNYLNAMLADTIHRVNFMPILFWLLAFALSIPFRCVHMIDLRKTSLYLGGTLIWVAILTFRVHHPDLVNCALWKVLDAGWLGISLIMIGTYNHLTLVWLFPSRTSEVEQ